MSVHAQRISHRRTVKVRRQPLGDVVAVALVRFGRNGSVELAAIDSQHLPSPLDAAICATDNGDGGAGLHVVLFTLVSGQLTGSAVVLKEKRLPRSLDELLFSMRSFKSVSLSELTPLQ